MDNKMNEIKGVLLMTFSALVGFFAPIQDLILAIIVLLSVNFASGLIEDALHAGGWSWKKAFKTFYELFVLCGIGFFVFAIGNFLHEKQGAIQCLTAIYFAAIWFYGVNILNNWKKILPEGSTIYRFISFIHFVVSLQIVEKIPYLKAFLQQENNENITDDNKEVDK